MSFNEKTIKLLKEIGNGVYSKVYGAELIKKPNTKYAVKIFKPEHKYRISTNSELLIIDFLSIIMRRIA